MCNTDNSKIKFTFDFSKDNFSKLKLNERVYSRKYSVSNVAWQLEIRKGVGEVSEKHVLECYLHVEGETKFWCCFARVHLTIFSQHDDMENYSEDYENLFSSACPSFGWPCFIYWDELMDPESGYIKNDTVEFQVHIVADAPQNVDPNYKRVTVAPVKSEDWLSLFQGQINKQIVCRISEEFKKVDSTVDKGFTSVNEDNSNMKAICGAVKEKIDELEKKIGTAERDVGTVKQNVDTVRQNVDTVKQNVDTMKQDVDMVKEDLGTMKQAVDTVKQDVSAVKVHVSQVVNAAVDELKNLLMKSDETSGEVDDCCNNDEKKKRNNEEKDSHETEARNEDFVVKKLKEFKIEIMKEMFSHLNRWSAEFRMPFGTSPFHGYHGPCFPHPSICGYGHKSESHDHLYGEFNCPGESVRHDQFGFAPQKMRARCELGCSTSSSSLTHHLDEIEKYLEKDNGNESVSSVMEKDSNGTSET